MAQDVSEGPSPGSQGWDEAFPYDDGRWVFFAMNQSQDLCVRV